LGDRIFTQAIGINAASQICYRRTTYREIFPAEWWFWAAASALEGRSTFVPARKEDAPGQMSQSKKEKS